MRRAPFATLVIVLAGCHHFDQEKMAATLRETVTAKAAAPYARGRWKAVQGIYAERDYAPIWLDRDRPRERTRQLVDALTHADEQGLRMREYDLPGLSDALQQAYRDKGHGLQELANLDLRLTALFLDYGSDLLTGRLDPATVDTGWYIKQRRNVADSTLRQAIQQDKFAAMVEPLTPQQKDYGELVKVLGKYRELVRTGGWPDVPAGPPLKPGVGGLRVAALRTRLAATGDIGSASGDQYDDGLADGVRRYQARNGLDTTGVVDAATRAALNVPVEARVRQIELNLERLRWLPTDFGSRYVLVNIPDYTLHAYEGGKETLTMRVVVGQEYGHATPVFADTMNRVVFQPYWNVPRSILLSEVVPKMREDRNYLAVHHYEVVRGNADEPVDPRSIDWNDLDTTTIDFRVRQRPGTDNALGRVKFIFPNQFNVYMHDTPARTLFGRDQRALSHGCVRLEHPDQFAHFVFEGDSAWPDERIRQAMTSDSSRDVTVKRPVPVYLVYLTAFMRDGRLNFRNDLYGTDQRALTRLGTPEPRATLDSARTALRKFFKS